MVVKLNALPTADARVPAEVVALIWLSRVKPNESRAGTATEDSRQRRVAPVAGVAAGQGLT